MADITDHVLVSNLIDALVDASYGQGIPLPGGEVNIGENIGTSGLGWYAGKDGVTLQFYNVDVGSDKVIATFNPNTNAIEIDIDPTKIEHQLLDGHGVADHDELDNHLARVDNPHRTEPGNLLPGTLADLNSVITDATLDDKSDPRDPNLHADTHKFSGADKILIDSILGEPIVGSPANEDDILAYETTPAKQWVPKPISSCVCRLPITVISATPYTVDLNADGPYLISRYTGGPTSIINLPDPATETPDDKAKSFYLLNEGTSIIQIWINSGGRLFSDGIQRFFLRPGEAVVLQLNQTSSGAVWSRRNSHLQSLLVGRAATWDAVNWGIIPPPSNGNPVPFDVMLLNDNLDVFNWNIATPTDIVLNRSGRFKAGFSINIDTTAPSGVTPIVAELALNGAGIVGSRVSLSANYNAGVDPQLVLFNFPFDAVSGDILTLKLGVAAGYSGQTRSVALNVESEV